VNRMPARPALRSGSGPRIDFCPPMTPSRYQLAGWLIAGALLLITGACGLPSTTASSTSGPSWNGAVLQNAPPKPEFVLTETSGKPYDFRAQTEGKVTLLYFGYTDCPDVCPTNMATIATALASLPAAVDHKIAVVFVTTDPARDTPPVIRAWLDQFDRTFVGLTGSPIDVASAQIQAGLGTSTKVPGNGSYGINHAAFIVVYTPYNRAHITFPGGMKPSAVASDLRRLVGNG
jgi:protein SCO1